MCATTVKEMISCSGIKKCLIAWMIKKYMAIKSSLMN